MEISIKNLSYVEKKSSSEKKYLKDINVDINKGTITGFLGDKITILGKLLNLEKKPSNGEIKINNISIKKNTKVSVYSELRKKIGFLKEENDYLFTETTVKEFIENILSNKGFKSNVKKRVLDSLRIVGLNDSYIDRNPNKLSYIEKKKILLASILSYNPDIIILENFNNGLSFREKESYKKLFLKLKSKLSKTIILLGNDVSFYFDLVDKLLVINNTNLVYEGNNKSFYDNELYNYVEMPKIVEFTNYVNDKGHSILQYTDFKELIKEIYRKV